MPNRLPLLLALLSIAFFGCYTTSGGAGMQQGRRSTAGSSPDGLQQYDTAVVARVTARRAPVRSTPNDQARPIDHLREGEWVVAYERGRGHLAVATPEGEPIGYVAESDLELQSSKPLASVEPDLAPRRSSSTSPPPGAYKDPGTATLFGFLITGGGQLYAGETAKGLALLAIGIAAPLVGYSATDVRTTCPLYGSCYDDTDYTPLYIGAGVSVAVWLYGMATAGSDARRANREAGFSARLRPAAVPSGSGALRPGIRLTLRW